MSSKAWPAGFGFRGGKAGGKEAHAALGPAGFFVPTEWRAGTKLDVAKLTEAGVLIEQGQPLAVVSQATGVLIDTWRKAIEAGRPPPLDKGPQPKQCR